MKNMREKVEGIWKQWQEQGRVIGPYVIIKTYLTQERLIWEDTLREWASAFPKANIFWRLTLDCQLLALIIIIIIIIIK